MTTTHPAGSMRRLGVIAGCVVGFTVGATGLAAARDTALTLDDSPELSAAIQASTGPDTTAVATTVADDSPDTTVADDSPDTTAVATTVADDSPDTTVADDSPTTTVADDGPNTTLPNSDDDGPNTTLPNSDDDGPNTTLPDSDDDGPNTTLPSTTVVTLPAPFSETYMSAGGSIHVSWTGTAFVLQSVDPAAGFSPEIEDQRWDKIRVDFDGDDDDSRIEVRLDDTGHVRVRID